LEVQISFLFLIGGLKEINYNFQANHGLNDKLLGAVYFYEQYYRHFCIFDGIIIIIKIHANKVLIGI